jgi:predicted DsbA family dithiol-disulfide isomerase
MPATMKIDFVSDVSCPWCIIGLQALEQAIERLGDTVHVALHFQPFELNPAMPAEGQDVIEHLTQKYGGSADDMQRNREAIRLRGAQLGFTFNMDKRSRVYNTFDAHRLLHWAQQEGHQLALKHALFDAYFTDGLSPASHAVLIACARKVGLDGDRAAAILGSAEFADEVRASEKFYLEQGIHSVPAVIINDQHLISGGQPVELFEKALRQIAGAS